MICNNCDRSIKDESKICPYCGYVLEKKEIGVTEHHNFAHETALAHNLKLTDEEIKNYGFSYKTVADPFVLFKDVFFIFFNLFSFMVYDFLLYFYYHNIVLTLTASILIMFICINFEFIFYKSNDFWFKGLIPIYNFLNLYRLFIRDYKSAYKMIYSIWFFSTIWVVLLSLSYFFLAAMFIDRLYPVMLFFLKFQAYLMSVGFIVYSFKSFFYIGVRFGYNPYLTMLFPILYVPIINSDPTAYYIEDVHV